MLTAKKTTVPSSVEVRSEAIQTLVKRMGITKAAVFIRDSMSQKTDYLQIKEQLFGNKSVEELYAEIRKGKRQK
jgi:hypothetical protein